MISHRLSSQALRLQAHRRHGARVKHADDVPSFQRRAREASLARLVRIRLYLAPAFFVIAGAFALFDTALWRRATLLVIILWMGGVTIVEWSRVQTGGPDAVNAPLNFVSMFVGPFALIAATGGVFSPGVVPLVMVRLVTAMFMPRGLRLLVDVLLIGGVLVLALLHPHLALIPESFGFAHVGEGPLPWIFAAIFSLFIGVSSMLGAVLAQVHEQLFIVALRERDHRLREHAEQNRALSALSAEIAHELKNPLSTIKGLATLVSKGLSGRDAERMGVVRREVDRMQKTMEDHLNFSRPLVPLGLETVCLQELVVDAVGLFEGVAAERSVSLDVRVPELEIRCDPRKLRQVLINLVQNAIDASPHGKVTVRATANESVEIFVEDEGRGLDAAVAERVFEAGVTTKANGSGIGLVVARALVRQHGGELTLRNGAIDGCQARVTLHRVAVVQTGADRKTATVRAADVDAPSVEVAP